MSSNTPAVRSARPSDAPTLRRLQSFLSEPAPTVLSAALCELAVSPETRSFQLYVSGADRVAVDSVPGGQPVGYALSVSGGTTHLVELVVAPDFRRQGRARALCSAVLASATPPVTVHVAADNTAARALYESVGFVEHERAADRFETSERLTLRYPGEHSPVDNEST